MNEWFCEECHRVFGAEKGKCCGKLSIPFDLIKHGRALISGSNSWITIIKYWENNELFKEISQKLTNDGCYSMPVIFNEFVEELEKG